MGSDKKADKKRKRESSSGADASTPSQDKAERKRLKKLRKEAAAQNGVELDVIATELADEVTPLVSPIASPMAGRKLTKKLFKTIGEAAKEKALRRGIKEVQLALRKGETGFVVLAGDVFPVDVIAHIPILCEERSIPYCFVSTKLSLGTASLTKRPTSVVLVSKTRAKGSLSEDIVAVAGDVSEIQNIY